MTPIERLEELAHNLWWSWQPEARELFRELNPRLWRETGHDPVSLLDRADSEALEKLANRQPVAGRIRSIHRRMKSYLDRTGPTANMEAGSLHASPVAYFCAEFCVHESLPIYSGGLGVLAGDHLKAASDAAIPVVGVGLFYHHGYFVQWIDDEGWQREEQGRTDPEQSALSPVTDADGERVTVDVPIADGEPIRARAWRAKVGRNDLYLLDTDLPDNPPEARDLSGQLYGGDDRTRIRQEAVLGIGGARLLDALDIRPYVYHLNEGHSAFLTLEICARLIEREGISFDQARRRVADRCVFTTHTPVSAGHDRFAPDLLDRHLDGLRERLGLEGRREFHGLGRVDLDNPDETFCMTVLGLKLSRRRNAVSNLHGRVSRGMWNQLWPERPTSEVPIGHITNGVHVGSFLAPEMKRLFDRYLDPDWSERLGERETWEGIASIPASEWWKTHRVGKERLTDVVDERVRSQRAPSGEGENEVVPGSGFEADALTIGFARRFALYKRADLLLGDRDRFRALVCDSDRPVQFVYAGKAHPADDRAKELIQRIISLTVDPAFDGRIVFLADYDLKIARGMLQGVDLWLNNPRRPQEACGTSGQKAVYNGALNCSILDGWWAEAYDGKNGFAFGGGREFEDPRDQDRHDARALYQTLENEVVPLYYDRDADGRPSGWIDRAKWALRSLGWRFNANRMVEDYLRETYLPAAGATQCDF
ncbi:MAG: alpha-glucan family phosphorylase [Bradymonadaceae bacterium]